MKLYIEKEYNPNTGYTHFYVWEKQRYGLDDCLRCCYTEEEAIEFAKECSKPTLPKVSTVVWSSPDVPRPPSLWDKFRDWCSE